MKLRGTIVFLIGVLAALGAGLCCTPACALELDEQLVCKSDAHTFIQPLLDDEYIDPNPMRVESNSVNAFRPKHPSRGGFFSRSLRNHEECSAGL